MQHNERHDEILNYLKNNRTAKVGELAKALFVSETTVRRALEQMQALGLVERTHGGAVLHENADEISVFVRLNHNAREKEKVATVALGLLPDFGTLFLDSSTTALALAGRLDLRHKTVVTNNLQAAVLLSKQPEISLLLLGGEVMPRSNSVVGSMTTRTLEKMRFDLMLVSCAALCPEGAFDNSLEQCEVKRVAFENSRRRLLLADGSKFGERGTYLLAPLAEFDKIVTDREPPFAAENIRY